MIIEEEEVKAVSEISPDVIEGLLDDDVLEESELVLLREEDEDADILDLAFTDDDVQW